MSGTLQLLIHAVVVGATIGLGIAWMPDRHWSVLVVASILWVAFWFHVAAAAWIPHWGTGRDWIDRIGIVVRGSGFAAGSIAMTVNSVIWSLILAVLGIILVVFGRALWEIMAVPRN